MEYFVLIFEFFAIKKTRTRIGIILFPILMSSLMYSVVMQSKKIELISVIQNEIITLLGILLGFTISLFAILISSNSSNINEAKKTFIDKKVLNKEINIFDVMLIGIAYSIVIECIMLIANITLPIFIESFQSRALFFAINIGLLSHIVVILLRSILDFYFADTKRK